MLFACDVDIVKDGEAPSSLALHCRVVHIEGCRLMARHQAAEVLLCRSRMKNSTLASITFQNCFRSEDLVIDAEFSNSAHLCWIRRCSGLNRPRFVKTADMIEAEIQAIIEDISNVLRKAAGAAGTAHRKSEPAVNELTSRY